MPIAYPDILDLRQDDLAFSWGPREAMIYALGVGMGADPSNEQELPFVYERDMKVLPTFASVIDGAVLPGDLGINYMMAVDAERKIIFHKPMDDGGGDAYGGDPDGRYR